MAALILDEKCFIMLHKTYHQGQVRPNTAFWSLSGSYTSNFATRQHTEWRWNWWLLKIMEQACRLYMPGRDINFKLIDLISACPHAWLLRSSRQPTKGAKLSPGPISAKFSKSQRKLKRWAWSSMSWVGNPLMSLLVRMPGYWFRSV